MLGVRWVAVRGAVLIAVFSTACGNGGNEQAPDSDRGDAVDVQDGEDHPDALARSDLRANDGPSDGDAATEARVASDAPDGGPVADAAPAPDGPVANDAQDAADATDALSLPPIAPSAWSCTA